MNYDKKIKDIDTGEMYFPAQKDLTEHISCLTMPMINHMIKMCKDLQKISGRQSKLLTRTYEQLN